MDQVRKLFAARQRASLWENFARRWQGVPSEGGEQVRATLGLDQRPVVLLATNVIGDSLTLGRQVFSDSMTEWLERTVQYLRQPPGSAVRRPHPPGRADHQRPLGGRCGPHGICQPSPSHIHLVPADAKVNTYDLVEIADLGLVYTTTVGMEMAMSGVPVIVVGNTHYRGKGFTLDPETWEEYFELLTKVLADPEPISPLASSRWSRPGIMLIAFSLNIHIPSPGICCTSGRIWKPGRCRACLARKVIATYDQTFHYLVGEPIDLVSHGHGY